MTIGANTTALYGSFSMPVMLTFAGRTLITGGTVVISDDDGARSRLAQIIERHQITGVVMTVPSLHRLLTQLRSERLEVGSLRALVVTGSPASPDLLAAAVNRLGLIVWQGYGQAESGMIALLTPDDIAQDRDAALASVGRPLPDVEIRLRDAEGRESARGEVGEICVRSPHAMDRYWRDPQATGEVMRDGWLYTRDLGHLDAAGRLRLTGRSRDVIIVNGEVCYAGAIERVLASHLAVDEAYVVGVPDVRTGEAIHAFIVPASDPLPDEAALDRFILSELTPGHVPPTITVIGELPLTAGGKPDKQALAALVPSRPEPSNRIV